VYHGRRLVNGVSGYNAPGYIALVEGLRTRDPETLAALASFGPLEAVAPEGNDKIQSFVNTRPGTVTEGIFDGRALFRIPRSSFAEAVLGPALPIAGVTTSSDQANAPLIHDSLLTTFWVQGPQDPSQWLTVDLGELRQVGGVTHYLGNNELEFPRLLAIDTSTDGATWEAARHASPVYAEMFLASHRAPLERDMRFAFAPRRARFVRLVQTGSSQWAWCVPEIQVNAPR